jgi:hypothetical protein
MIRGGLRELARQMIVSYYLAAALPGCVVREGHLVRWQEQIGHA